MNMYLSLIKIFVFQNVELGLHKRDIIEVTHQSMAMKKTSFLEGGISNDQLNSANSNESH